MDRLHHLLARDGSADARVGAAVISAGLGGAVMHPLVEGFDDDTLRSLIVEMSRRLVDLPE